MIDKSEKYYKKPPAKRPSYIKLGISSPFCPDWYSLLGLPIPAEVLAELAKQRDNATRRKNNNEEDIKTGKQNEEMEEKMEEGDEKGTEEQMSTDEKHQNMDIESDQTAKKQISLQPFYLLRAGHAQLLKDHIFSSSSSSSFSLSSLFPSFSLPERSLVCVSIKMATRGTPKWNATIYAPTERDINRYYGYNTSDSEELSYADSLTFSAQEVSHLYTPNKKPVSLCSFFSPSG